MTQITKEQADVYRILMDVGIKFLLAVATVLVFCAVTVVLIIWPSWTLATVEIFLTMTVGQVFKHYFPATSA